MTTNSRMVFNYLVDHYNEEKTKQEIAADLGISLAAVVGSVNSLVKKGLVDERIETIEIEPATDTKAAKTKDIRYEKLNEAGLQYDPDAEEAAKKAAKEAAKAAQ